MELTITLPEDADRVALLGASERHLKLIRETLGISAKARDQSIRLSGDDKSVHRAAAVIADLTRAARRRRPMSHEDLLDRIRYGAESEGGSFEEEEIAEGGVVTLDVYAHGRRLRAQTDGQSHYLRAIKEHDLVFCTGPAGTGKTYLAVAMAVSLLKRGLVRKLVLARPAVEAGEKLGFLPGDLQQKVNPYLRPLLDGLNDMMSFEQVQRFLQSDVIEVVPLAFMRGRTLNDAAIILDEAQNTTRGQMLMFLTRMGHGSKMIVTGDTSQTDLDEDVESGLVDAARRLGRVPGVGFVALGRQDIVRHGLVQKIVDAYGPQNEV